MDYQQYEWELIYAKNGNRRIAQPINEIKMDFNFKKPKIKDTTFLNKSRTESTLD